MVIITNHGLGGVKGSHGSKLALAEFEQEYFYPSDIQSFLKNYSLPVANISRIVGLDDPFDGDLGEVLCPYMVIIDTISAVSIYGSN